MGRKERKFSPFATICLGCYFIYSWLDLIALTGINSRSFMLNSTIRFFVYELIQVHQAVIHEILSHFLDFMYLNETLAVQIYIFEV